MKTSATLMFYDATIWDKIKGYDIKPPADIVSISSIEKELKPNQIGKSWRMMGRIYLGDNDLDEEDISKMADDFVGKFGDRYSGIISIREVYNIDIPQYQRPIIIPAFVQYFSRNFAHCPKLKL